MANWASRIGFDIHTSYAAYADLGKVRAALDYFGVDLVRNNDPAGAAKLPERRTIFVVSTYDPAQAVAQVKQALAAKVWAIEGVNEPPLAQANQARQVNLAITNLAAGKCRVLASSPGLPNLGTAKTIGYLPGVTHGSIHPYRADLSDAVWTKRIADMLADMDVLAPNLPTMVTETGLWLADSNPLGLSHHPTTPANAVAQLVPNLQTFFGTGRISHVIYYQLLETTGSPPPENAFGFFDGAGVPKPHAVELRRYLDFLRTQEADVPPVGVDPRISSLAAQVSGLNQALVGAAADLATANQKIQRASAALA